ncbi:MAG: exodeoxyribonuclease VII large subunit, partial [Lachnospiraceae bacterium]
KLSLRLNYLSPVNRIRDQRTHALKLEESLTRAMEGILTDRRHRLSILVEQFKGLSPLTKLNQGYSYVEDGSGRALKKVGQVKQGDEITIHVTDGQVLAKVTDKSYLVETEKGERG